MYNAHNRASWNAKLADMHLLTATVIDEIDGVTLGIGRSPACFIFFLKIALGFCFLVCVSFATGTAFCSLQGACRLVCGSSSPSLELEGWRTGSSLQVQQIRCNIVYTAVADDNIFQACNIVIPVDCCIYCVC